MANENPEPGWTYQPGSSEATQTDNPQPAPEAVDQQPAELPPHDPQKSVSWTASEFVSNHKSANWHLSYFLFLAVFIAAVFIFTRDIISAVVIAIVGGLFIVIANNKPRQLPYEVDNKGISISDKFYPYEDFKSFSLSGQGAAGSIDFMPLKRFMPEISIFFPPEEGDKILDIISEHLPNDQVRPKKVDSLFKKIRF